MLIETLPPDVARALEAELRRGWELDRSLTYARRGDIQKAMGTPVRAIDGVGELKARIDPISFHYWGKKLGYQCWEDKTFVDEYLRDTPEARVKSMGTKAQVGHAQHANR